MPCGRKDESETAGVDEIAGVTAEPRLGVAGRNDELGAVGFGHIEPSRGAILPDGFDQRSAERGERSVRKSAFQRRRVGPRGEDPLRLGQFRRQRLAGVPWCLDRGPQLPGAVRALFGRRVAPDAAGFGEERSGPLGDVVEPFVPERGGVSDLVEGGVARKERVQRVDVRAAQTGPDQLADLVAERVDRAGVEVSRKRVRGTPLREQRRVRAERLR